MLLSHKKGCIELTLKTFDKELNHTHFLIDFIKKQNGNKGVLLITRHHALVSNHQKVIDELITKGIISKTFKGETECYFYTQPSVTVIQLDSNANEL